MAHFAEIKNNIVQRVIVIDNYNLGEPTFSFPATCPIGRVFIANTLKLDGVWKQTSYNNNFRGTYASIGYTYDADADVFVAPQPFGSWTLDANHDWQPPTPMPSDASMEKPYEWNEEELAWVAI